jgi:ADP-heptose:LPS heptosyltransferase
MGDVLQVTPLLHGLKQSHPDAEVHLLVSRDYECLVKYNPWVDRIIPFPVEQFIEEVKKPSAQSRIQGRIRNLVDTLREERYDLVINRQFTRFEMCLVPCLFAKEVLGPFYSPLDSLEKWMQNLWISLRDELPLGRANFNADPKTAHHIWNTVNNRKGYRTNLVDVGLDLSSVAGPGRVMTQPGPEDRARAEELFSAAGFDDAEPLLGVQVGASKSFRFLSPEMLVEALTLWQVRHGGRIIFFGTRNERNGATSIIRKLRHPETALNLAGKTSLLELAACLERIDFLLTPDTGTLHMAAAVGTPTVSLFYGSASPWETCPYGKGHLIIYSDLPCAPCKNTDQCRLDGFCKNLFSSSSVVGVMDLAYDLIKEDHQGEGKSIVQEWARVWAKDYSSCGFRVLFTGWDEVTAPLTLFELTSPTLAPMPRLSPPRVLKPGTSQKPKNLVHADPS